MNTMDSDYDGIKPGPQVTEETVQEERDTPDSPTNSTLATLAFIAGLVSVTGAFLFLMFPPLNWVVAGIATLAALWMGAMALGEKGGGRTSRSAKKFAVAGMVLALIGPVAVIGGVWLSNQETYTDRESQRRVGPRFSPVEPLEERQSEPPVRERRVLD